MTKILLSTLCLCTLLSVSNAQDSRVTTIDFVEVLNDNHDEALYYYQNNWQELRKMAVSRGFISSYQLLETQPSEDSPFSFMLVTTFANNDQYEKVEDNFKILIEEKGGLRLLNDKKPGEFRKIIYNKSDIKHWE